MPSITWSVILLVLLAGIPLIIYWTRRAASQKLEQAIDRLVSGETISPEDPLRRAVEFHARRQNLDAVARLEQLQAEMAASEQRVEAQRSELKDEAMRLETLHAQLEDEQRWELVLRECAQSLGRDFVSSINENEHDHAIGIATHLTALLREPFSASHIGSSNLLELIDEVLVRLAPAAGRRACRFQVIPTDASLPNVEINAPRFQDILFHLLAQHLANNMPSTVGIEFTISDNSAMLDFSTESGDEFDPVITIRLDEALTNSDARWTGSRLEFPVRPHPGTFARERELRALVVADSELERRSLAGRLGQLGLETTTDFNSGIVDVCVVADETSESFRALHPYLSDSTYVPLLGNRTIHQNPLWVQVDDPITQGRLNELISDIAIVRDETAHKQILAVDDSQANIQLLEMQLTELGHSVTIARSGSEALAQVEKTTLTWSSWISRCLT